MLKRKHPAIMTKYFRFLGTLYVPASVLIRASERKNAVIRAAYGEFDVVEHRMLDAAKFIMDHEKEAEEIALPGKQHRYRVIFTEQTMYGVEFLSNLPLKQITEHQMWRDELDKYSVSNYICWQAENALDVGEPLLEHIEELPMKAGGRK
jgi:hypothetical protein